MFRVLVVYGTTEGHTAKIARAVARTIDEGGIGCDLIEAGSAHEPDRYDGVVVAASVHSGRYQKNVVDWVRRHNAVLNRMPAAFISVCLGVLEKNPKIDRELQEVLGRFLNETGWRPRMTTIAAGALLYSKYNWYVRWIMKRIAAKAGGDTDTSRDYEYTDWAAISRFTVQFLRLAEVQQHDTRHRAVVNG